MPRGTSDRSGLRLQQRCIDILNTLGHVSVLDTTTIHERWWPGKSLEACRSKLRLYQQHGLIQSLHLELTSTTRNGRLPAVHRLTDRGADVIETITGERPTRTARSSPPSPYTLMHRIGMARIVLNLDDACRLQQLPRPNWLLEYDPQPNARPGGTFAERFQLRFDLPGEFSTVSCWPDAACRLTCVQDDRQWKLALLFEYDRGTETLNQVSGKMTGYAALLKTQAYQQLWPDVQAARIMFIVPCHRRRTNVAEVLKDCGAAASVRLAAEEDLSPDRILNEPVWWSVLNEPRAILKN